MKLVIEIAGPVVERKGDGYTSYSQEAYAFMPNQKYPSPIALNVASVNEAYPVGRYEIDFLESLYIRDRVLTLSRRLKLVPVKQAAAA